MHHYDIAVIVAAFDSEEVAADGGADILCLLNQTVTAASLFLHSHNARV